MSTPNAPADQNGAQVPATTTTFLSPNSVFAEARPGQGRRAAGATAASIVFHGALILLIAFLLAKGATQTAMEPPRPTATIVYLDDPGPGGGGGGSPAPAPPKPIEIPKTPPAPPVPVTPPPPVVVPPPPPPPSLSVPVMTPNAVEFQASGTSSVSLAAYGGGGRGRGLGAGSGSGVGEGTGGGFGGGAYRPGSGITNPVPLRMPRPGYTSEAMRAKIQGQVELEAVINEDGTVGDVRVVRSLDRTYGLDLEAMKAAKLWVFRPATDRTGKPVAIVVRLELTFTIH